MKNIVSGTIRNFEKFFRAEGFSKSESIRLVSKLKKSEDFQARDERNTSFAHEGRIKTVRICSDDSNSLKREIRKQGHRLDYLTKLVVNRLDVPIEPREEAIEENSPRGKNEQKNSGAV